MPSPAVETQSPGFPTVAVVGGGQLARMLVPPAVALGVHLRVLAEDAADSAALVAAHAVGRADDEAAVRAVADGAAVVTFDHEHVPQPLLAALEADGLAVRPGAAALLHAQDKLAMRRRLAALDVPVPAWAEVGDVTALDDFVAAHEGGAVLKTPRGGYDGKGVLVVRDGDAEARATAASWFERAGGAPLLVEELVPFTRELAVLLARSPSGQAALWPVVETVQEAGVCREVLAPAPGLDDDLAGEAAHVALRVAGELGVTGVLAVEGFEVPGPHGPRFLVNELAMRPHNSGHWTIDGSTTSQFEQHLRAVLDLPLGDTRARTRWTVMANVLGGEHPDLYRAYLHVMARDPGVKVHLYGKAVRPGRKIGHVTVSGDDPDGLDALRERARHAADYITGTVTE
ncbi:5-(carboxyamino)imidazole ribonucleotide synthase [Aquipuribacter nitratireducens]|uniref:N5-carboxyaminoimidazole ribonucleotide synthase n=1 Tax=Aquipuribacter nitratireducens TaxID=650104 RepID=A0ABW0GL85_9MICO